MNTRAYLVEKPKEKLKQGEDYYFLENGLMVFTMAYHFKRGLCCKNDCKHCPYIYIN